MHPRVRSLYKNIMYLASEHPTKSLNELRPMIKRHFMDNKNVEVGSNNWKKCLAKGRYYGIKQLQTIIHMHKYRTMKSRYYK